MKQRLVNLPVVGRIQHGERTEKRVTELGYFIAKIDDVYFKSYLDRFNQQYKGKQSIDIVIFNDEPLTMKYARFNQGGEVCSSVVDSNIANMREKNGWKQIQCDTYNCQYRKRNEQGKCACNRIGWLKFIIPSVCKDRIFLMRITGQTSLERLNDYFTLQQIQGYPITGQYTLFLKQEEQLNCLGQTFNNYILDIVRKDNFNSNNLILENNQKDLSDSKNLNGVAVKNDVKPTNTKQLSNTALENSNVDIDVSDNISQGDNKQITSDAKALDNGNIQKEKEAKKSSTKSGTTKKATKTKSKEVVNEQVTIDNKEQDAEENNDFNNCYSLLRTYKQNITDKEYLIGEFADINDQTCNIIINPDYAKELEECELGTLVKLEISEVKGKKFAMKVDFISKLLKKVVA